ncbi:MAG: translation initiation factor IF-2 subunit alpha [Candidatus Baldrarchaeia archaeon]
MVRRRRELPEVGEYVIATVRKIEPYGVYVTLDEYNNHEGFIHVSEVASTWVRNIRDWVREDQKVVAKVLRVDPRKKHVDLSLKRVTEQWKRQKMTEWKRAQRAENLLRLAAERLNKTLDDAYEEAGWKLEDFYGEIYAGLEAAVEGGKEALLKAGVSEEWARVLSELARRYIEIPKVKVKGCLELRCFKPDGVTAIRNALLKALEVAKSISGVKVDVYLLGSPRWRIEVEAKERRFAEEVINKVANTALDAIKEAGGFGSFTLEEGI